MTTFELENTRLIKNICQQLGITEDLLAKEIGAAKEQITSWKRGAEIPPTYKRRLSRLGLIAEHGKQFMSLLEKVGQGIDVGSIFEFGESEVMTEGESDFAQSINEYVDKSPLDFGMWQDHNHFTISLLHTCLSHNVFNAYVDHQPGKGVRLFPEFFDTFIFITNHYYDWICIHLGVDSLAEIECEVAHLIIEVVVYITCREIIEHGYSSDYDDALSVAESFEQEGENKVEELIALVKHIEGSININYYELLNPYDLLSFDDETVATDLRDDEYDSSLRIERHFSLEGKQTLKLLRHLIYTTAESHSFAEEKAELFQNIFVGLINATQELVRLDEALQSSDTHGKIKVNKSVLSKCKRLLKGRGLDF